MSRSFTSWHSWIVTIYIFEQWFTKIDHLTTSNWLSSRGLLGTINKNDELWCCLTVFRFERTETPVWWRTSFVSAVFWIREWVITSRAWLRLSVTIPFPWLRLSQTTLTPFLHSWGVTKQWKEVDTKVVVHTDHQTIVSFCWQSCLFIFEYSWIKNPSITSQFSNHIPGMWKTRKCQKQ